MKPAEYITNSVLRVLGEDTATRNDTTDKLKTSYEVPFVMWANYDIEEKEVDAISTNYLSGLLMDTAGLEKDRLSELDGKTAAAVSGCDSELLSGNRWHISAVEQ